MTEAHVEETRDDRICTSCKSDAPSTAPGETFISRRGWRCVRRVEGGVIAVDWYCPACWARRKAGAGAA